MKWISNLLWKLPWSANIWNSNNRFNFNSFLWVRLRRTTFLSAKLDFVSLWNEDQRQHDMMKQTKIFQYQETQNRRWRRWREMFVFLFVLWIVVIMVHANGVFIVVSYKKRTLYYTVYTITSLDKYLLDTLLSSQLSHLNTSYCAISCP